MKIAFVSTYPPTKCGIATYTLPLASAIAENPDVEISVYGDSDSASSEKPFKVEPIFKKKTDFVRPLLAAAARYKPDIMHFQHTPDIFGMGGAFYELLDELGRMGVRRVITLHTVYTQLSGIIERKPHAVSFHRKLATLSDALVVHQPSMVEILKSQGLPQSKIFEIPHWTGPAMQGDGASLRKRLEIPADAPLLLFFGFIHVQKNLHTVLKAMPTLLETVPDAHLLIAGSIAGGTWYNKLYSSYLKYIIDSNNLRFRIHAVTEFIPQEEVEDYYAAADIVLMPHKQGYGSASGVAHQALSARKLMLCSDGPKFEEIGLRVSRDLMAPASSPAAWAEKAAWLLSSTAPRTDLLARIQRYAEASSTTAVAEQHIKLYKSLL